MINQKYFRIIKIIAKTLLYLLLIPLTFFAIKYITCPIYKFKPPHPFTGDIFYNPYQHYDSNHWKKANFQIQSYAWKGITSGRGNTNEVIHNVYKNLSYDIIATSDYQKINRYREDKPDYIPVYEHGYGIKKSHQVLLGAQKVLWIDYPLFQSIHNKQHILNLLKKENELVYIAHPKLWNAYSLKEMELLSNYDGIEVLNNYGISLEHWDAALSSGKYVTIIGNDDAHDIYNPNELGRHCTFINSPTLTREDIIKSLELGKSFGASTYLHFNEPLAHKIERLKVLQKLKKFEIISDTIFLEVDSIPEEIKFIGQGGKIHKKINHSNKVFYVLKDSDTYIRAEIKFSYKHIYFLNPVCRTNELKPPGQSLPEIDIYRTFILRIVGFSSLIFLLINIIFIRKKLKTRKESN